jgi:hypothetical protein
MCNLVYSTFSPKEHHCFSPLQGKVRRFYQILSENLGHSIEIKILQEKVRQFILIHVEPIVLNLPELFSHLFATAERRKSCRTCPFLRDFWVTFWLIPTHFDVE